MHPRSRYQIGVLPILLLVLPPLTACSPGKKAEAPAPAAEERSVGTAPAGAGVDLDAVVKKARGATEQIRLTMAASRETKIEVLDAKPSDVPGLVILKLRVSRQGRTAVRHLEVTPDLKYALVGAVVPIGTVPRVRVDLENVKLEGAPSRGNPDAKVTIVEYSDFQCPFCRAMEPVVERVLREYGGKVRLVFKHYPLEMHDWAMDAAMLAECARAQKPELFWKLHDYFYSKGTGVTHEDILQKVQEQLKGEGIDMDAFNKCYLDKTPAKGILAEIDEGKTVGVRGTPAFLVNDVFMSGAVAYPIMEAIVREQLGEPRIEGGSQDQGAKTAEGGA